MLIQTEFLPSRDLQIDAYSYNPEEFMALEDTLAAAGIGTAHQQLPPDDANREGRRFTSPTNQVGDLEAVLEGRFQPSGRFVPAVGSGGNYACREISITGRGRGCEDLSAPDDAVAKTKCAIIAGNNSWFGGVPGRGQCP